MYYAGAENRKGVEESYRKTENISQHHHQVKRKR
jgi:hypothetical protein